MNRIFVHKSWDLLLLLIVIVAFLLRFWRFTDIPFTFDELSAMSRTVYDNFRDLIKYGVIEKDTHPAGVQVFMYYWIRMFGEAEWVVKLPFMLMGLASVWAAYAIAKLWFNATTAILTAACIATLQLFVLYSQIARPYASGLFLTLMMVYFWSRYFLKDYKLTDLVLFILFAALSSYNHHFSLLFAAIVGFSGLWFVSKDKRRAYVFAGIAIFILYI
ncbi:MAG TPA: glycosyltransferase family 39 protein, partial [Bacteroidetes bacterium]|nr:glycosyltransferase family 39 protein [Bacteroidota bacterium]